MKERSIFTTEEQSASGIEAIVKLYLWLGNLCTVRAEGTSPEIDITACPSKELELAVAEAVRKTASGCDDFVGVIVDRKKPKTRFDPNWEIRGVKFGKTDKKMVGEALATVVAQLQREFRLADRSIRKAAPGPGADTPLSSLSRRPGWFAERTYFGAAGL